MPASAGGDAGCRKMLESACLGIVHAADLGDVKPIIRRFERNLMIEINRPEAFIRLYVAEDVRCSVRVDAGKETLRRNDFLLYAPAEGDGRQEARRFLAEDVQLGRTLESIARMPCPEGPDAHLRRWLDRFCREQEAQERPVKVKMSLSIDPDAYQLLREYAFAAELTPNRAAADIVASFVRSWKDGDGR